MKDSTIALILIVFALAIGFSIGFELGWNTKELPDIHEENGWYKNKVLEWVPPASGEEESNPFLIDPFYKERNYKLLPKSLKGE